MSGLRMINNEIEHIIEQGEGETAEALMSGNYISKHRNKLTTEAFYLTGDIEKYGTGIGRLKDWFADYTEISFVINDLDDFIQVVVQTTDQKTDQKTDEDKIIELIKTNNKITIKEISEAINKGITVTKERLNKLKDRNIIQRTGPDKGGYCEIK